MPRKQIDYSKTIIYKIQHIEKEDLLYVGSTTDFTNRKSKHKSDCKNNNSKIYQMMRENGGWEEFKMIEIEKFPCNDKREAEKRENDLMKDLKSNMNSNRSFITEEEKKLIAKEYYQNNKEQKKLIAKEYYENNKEQRKQYYENNKEQMKLKSKVYYENNKDKKKQYYQKYYENKKK